MVKRKRGCIGKFKNIPQEWGFLCVFLNYSKATTV